jgi:glycosyltransferase involved in cell wall biosynthesis
MDALHFSFIIPVYNRPEEINELLQSFTTLDGAIEFEVVIIEDGSDIGCKHIVEAYKDKLNLLYFYKQNSGPGASRNYGMQKAHGNYFIILDSDCILPSRYLKTVHENLSTGFVDCYGGPDTAHKSFTNLQKAIDFAMTSFITTGGIRGGKTKDDKFQPRSFNMGLSKKAFEASNGFGLIHPGEDPDLSIRLTKLGFKTQLFAEAFVYHKRRISWSKFYKQVNKFGLVRPILNQWHPETERLIFWLPTVFGIGFIIGFILFVFGIDWLLLIYGFYFTIAFVLALLKTKSLIVAFQAMIAILIQFFGYGFGFIKSTLALKLLNKKPENLFPFLFFKHAN